MDGPHYFRQLSFNTVQETMAGPLEILMLGVVGVVAFRVLFLRRRNQVSLLVPMVAAALIVSVLLMGYAATETRRGPEPPVSRVTIDRGALSVSVDMQRPAIPDPVAERTETPSESTSVRIEETEHGNMLVMPLSSAILENYLGPEGTTALESMTSALPEELSQAYFMVPIPGAVGDAVPGLRALASAISQVAQRTAVAVESAAPVVTAETAEAPPNEPTAAAFVPVRPQWVTHPGEDQIVVTTEFEESRELTESQLRRQVTKALLDTAWSRVAAEGMLPVTDDREFRMTDEAIDSCLQDRFRDEVELQMASGPTTMYSTSALLRFPEELQFQAVRHVEASLRNQRTWTVGVATVSLGLVVMLAAGLFQLAGSSGRLARFVGVPVMAVMMLPGVAISGRLVQQVVANENADVPSPFALQDTLIDYQPHSEGAAENRPLPRNVEVIEVESDWQPGEIQILD